MLRTVAFLSMVIMILSFQGKAFGFETFKCNGHRISPGLLSSEVRERCGEPDHTIQWEFCCERCLCLIYCYEGRCHPLPKEVQGPIKMECWAYNLGSNQFVRFLKFQNGELLRIKTGAKCSQTETGVKDKCKCEENTFTQ